MKKIKKALKRDWQLYLYLLIPMLLILIFSYIPMGGLLIAFQDFNARKGFLESEWVGLENFIKFFESYESKRVIKNTIVLSLYSIIAGAPIPISFALLLNSVNGKRFKAFGQNVVCFPNFISVTVLIGTLLQLFNARTGLYGIIGEKLTGTYPPDLMASSSAFRHMYVWSGIWQSFGWCSIIYTAALSAVSPEYHEAARIDGATRFQRIIHVDFPCIRPTFVIQLILSTGNVMNIGFEKVFLMQNGLNLEASSIISTYVYNMGIKNADFSYSTAIGLFNSVVNLIVLVLVNWIAGKVSETSLW